MMPLECACEGGRIVEAAVQRHLRHGTSTQHQKAVRLLEPLLQHVRIRRKGEHCGEGPAEVELGEAMGFCKRTGGGEGQRIAVEGLPGQEQLAHYLALRALLAGP